MIERDRLIFGATPTRWAAGVPAVAALAGILFAMSFATARGTEIRSERFDWAQGAASPTAGSSQTAVILNDAFMIRGEVAATA